MVFSNESLLCIRWSKYWSFSFTNSRFNEYSGLISFKMDELDLLAIQGTLKSLFQHYSSKSSILQCSSFFRVQYWHAYMTTGKTIAWTRWKFVGKIMSLLFNMFSRLIIDFLAKRKYFLISWLQATFAVILESQKIVCHCFHCFPIYLPWSDGTGIPDHLTCLLRKLYAGQEATVRTGHGTTDWFQIGKGVLQGCILSPCLFNLHAEYIMRNAGLDEAQGGIKIAGRDTILWQKAKKN